MKSTTHTLLQHIGLQLHDAAIYRQISYDGLTVTFKVADNAAHLMAAIQTEERFAHMGAELVNAEEAPTIDEICGAVPPSWSAHGSNRYTLGYCA